MKPIDLVLAAISLMTLIATTPAGASPLEKSNAMGAANTERRLAHCSWDRPGVDPFMGDVVAAVDHYRDISPVTREKLKARMVKREYDEIVSIDRDSIRGKKTYGATIRDMHFGTNQVCGNVTRTSWRPDTKERGLVYCEGRECILVPTVCRNVSRISRAEVMAGAATDAAAPAAATAAASAADAAPAADASPAGADEPVSGGVAAGPGEPDSFAMLSGAGKSAIFSGPAGALAGAVHFSHDDRPDTVPGDNAGTTGTPRTGSIDRIGSNRPSLPIPTSLPIVAPPVPEPQSVLLMAAGLAALAWRVRRQASQQG